MLEKLFFLIPFTVMIAVYFLHNNNEKKKRTKKISDSISVIVYDSEEEAKTTSNHKFFLVPIIIFMMITFTLLLSSSNSVTVWQRADVTDKYITEEQGTPTNHVLVLDDGTELFIEEEIYKSIKVGKEYIITYDQENHKVSKIEKDQSSLPSKLY